MNILFVCLGNICRSPMADGVMRNIVQQSQLKWNIDSAGTSNFHIGERADVRAIAISEKHNVDLNNLRARQFIVNDFDDFDLIFAMDAQNYRDIINLARSEDDKNKVELFLNRIEPGMNRGLRDPWLDDDLFEPVFLEIKNTCEKIMSDLK